MYIPLFGVVVTHLLWILQLLRVHVYSTIWSCCYTFAVDTHVAERQIWSLGGLFLVYFWDMVDIQI